MTSEEWRVIEHRNGKTSNLAFIAGSYDEAADACDDLDAGSLTTRYSVEHWINQGTVYEPGSE